MLPPVWAPRERHTESGCFARAVPAGYPPAVHRIQRINTDHPLYRQECLLREDVLLGPIGYDMDRFRSEFTGVEEKFEHFVAVVDQTGGTRVIGCAALLPNYPVPGVGKLMQMAVDRQRQGEGVGRSLVSAVEARAFGELGLTELFCHSQTGVKGFYESLGWRAETDEFTEAGVPHRKMVLRGAAGEEHAVPVDPEEPEEW